MKKLKKIYLEWKRNYENTTELDKNLEQALRNNLDRNSVKARQAVMETPGGSAVQSAAGPATTRLCSIALLSLVRCCLVYSARTVKLAVFGFACPFVVLLCWRGQSERPDLNVMNGATDTAQVDWEAQHSACSTYQVPTFISLFGLNETVCESSPERNYWLQAHPG